MKKIYMVEGLACANCAAKIERAVSALPGVSKCQVSFLTGKMTLEAAEDTMDATIREANKIVSKIEPGAVLQNIR